MQPLVMDRALQEALDTLCDRVHRRGGRALLVGGCVRDALWRLPVKELDIEVYGMRPDRLKACLADGFQIDLVGESFGVIKLRGLAMDVSIPRREAKSGRGHRGFETESDPDMPVAEAARRRDFTINAMAYDPRLDRLYDYYQGEADLRLGLLRHTSERFVEDPLRVLRGMQFAARFALRAVPETLAICARMDAADLARERIFEEWRKFIVKGSRPSSGLAFLRDSEWIRYYPELERLIGCPQDPEWHPEGDVWTHTGLCMDAFADRRLHDDREDLIVGLAVLCHDFGKPCTTIRDSGRIRSRGHAEAGEASARDFLSRLTLQTDVIEAVLPLVRNHLQPRALHDGQASDAAIRRLACRVKRIDRLVRVAEADRMGTRGSDPTRSSCDFPAGAWLLDRAAALGARDTAPAPLMMGRHLIDLGLSPGPAFGPLLKACFQAQIAGRIRTVGEGIAFVQRMMPDGASQRQNRSSENSMLTCGTNSEGVGDES